MKLDKSMIDQYIAQIAEVDGKLTASSGTLTQRKAEALEVIKSREADAIHEVEASGAEVDAADRAEHFPVHTLELVTAELEAAKVRFEEAKQAVEDAVVAHLKASKTDASAEVATLRKQREELVETVKAMSVLLKVDVNVPKAPKGSGSNGSSTPRAKSSQGAHYVKAEDGSVSSYANDTFSGLAFYAFKRAGVADLKSALAANGITDLAKSWEATVTVNGVTRTIGHTVTAPEATEG